MDDVQKLRMEQDFEYFESLRAKVRLHLKCYCSEGFWLAIVEGFGHCELKSVHYFEVPCVH